MKVALIGITGHVGSRLATELLRRGHKITGIARHPGNETAPPGLVILQGDATVKSKLAPLLISHDVVISASRFQTSDPGILINAVKEAKVRRLLVVGGAATLQAAQGIRLIDAPGFPEAYRAEALAGVHFLDALYNEKDLEWTFLSPSAEFVPGERTGKFRLGADQLLTDSHGRSWISMEDYAIAMVDEMEQSKHLRQRFTVGY
jgi:putative NADH-flavin reductase